MRRYDEPVEVHRGPVAGWPAEGPEQFLWRGRLWKVRAVIAHWVETGPWWQHAGMRAVIGSEDGAPLLGGLDTGPDPAPPGSMLTALEDLLGERELWRVEAGRGPARRGPTSATGDDPGDVGAGTFDLAYDEVDGRWQLVGCTD